ncbi:MAG: hypothetical protein OJF51_004126 [Nitrospira sp.]|jgi:hypothetical protein|nr:MAG: hypothetical protein OJF51_004126 [Nitrospira sp.]
MGARNRQLRVVRLNKPTQRQNPVLLRMFRLLRLFRMTDILPSEKRGANP